RRSARRSLQPQREAQLRGLIPLQALSHLLHSKKIRPQLPREHFPAPLFNFPLHRSLSIVNFRSRTLSQVGEACEVVSASPCPPVEFSDSLPIGFLATAGLRS